MKIYTKTGDKGETGIIGKRISKASETIDLIGILDELNASLGIIEYHTRTSSNQIIKNYREKIHSIQYSIFSIGALIANANQDIDWSNETTKLEQSIDLMEENLEPIKSFILPGGSELAAHIHMCRAICRKAERKTVKYIQEIKKDDDSLRNIQKYLNRLSDWLFVYARFVNKELGVQDIPWNRT